MLRDTTKEKIPAYFTGFAVEKSACALGFRAFKIPIREGVDLGREGPPSAALRPRRGHEFGATDFGPSWSRSVKGGGRLTVAFPQNEAATGGCGTTLSLSS